jgi:ABC-2 type transport system ATP-binding protein
MLVHLKGVTKRFGDHVALDAVDLDVAEGDIYGLLGPNGSGKTTTMRLLEGLLEPDEGEITVFGQRTDDARASSAQMNALPESHGVYGWMRAPEYLRFFGELYGRTLPEDEIGRRLKDVGLDPSNRRAIRGYSRGMKQRLGLARAMINDPKLLLLDEPTSGLDPRGRSDIHDLLLRLNKERQLTILLSTHILDDVERLCNRIAILDKGKVRYQGSPGDDSAGSARSLQIRAADPAAAAKSLPGLKSEASREGWVTYALQGIEPAEGIRRLVAAGVLFSEARVLRQSLESLYLAHTSGGAS